MDVHLLLVCVITITQLTNWLSLKVGQGLGDWDGDVGRRDVGLEHSGDAGTWDAGTWDAGMRRCY